LFSAVVSTPALHAWHRKHSTCWSLLHALQSTASAVVDAPVAGVTQNVAFTASNLQYAGGLQQPDCTYGTAVQTVSAAALDAGMHDALLFSLSVLRMNTAFLPNILET
jgi:hypothetical protein